MDYLFTSLEKIGEELEVLEKNVVGQPTPQILKKLFTSKRKMLLFRRLAWPLRDVVQGLLREETVLIPSTLHIYYRDLYDHVVELIDIVETMRELSSSLVELYLSSTSNTLNTTMKTLTAVSTLFIPLTFITGLFGTNFQHIPGSSYYFGFYFLTALLGILAFGLLYTMKKNKLW